MERALPGRTPFRCPSSTKKCDGRHIVSVTEVTPALVTRDTPLRGPRGDDVRVWSWALVLGSEDREREGEVNQVAEKRITPKKATKSPAKRSLGEAATRVTKRKMKKMRKSVK